MPSTPGEPEEGPLRLVDRASLAGAAAAGLWVLLCIRWFDPAPSWRPAALEALPPGLLALPAAVLGGLWLRARWPTLKGSPLESTAVGLVAVLALAFFFRLPIVAQGAGAAVTPDGALSGIVALHVRDGIENLVFVPHVPYSGSLKSHITAPLALVMDPARAFALVSVLFYLVYVAGLYRLALLVSGPRAALLAGLYAAFSPAFVTRYSVSNDGNYVEVLAFGTWALWLAARWTAENERRTLLALAAGLLLGLAFWCHILAVIPLAALGLVFVLVGRLSSLPSLGALAVGWVLGYAPGLVWNSGHDWLSFQYLLPGEARGGGTGIAVLAADLGSKAWAMVVDGWPVLMGYDWGYGPFLDGLLTALGWLGVVAALVATAAVARRALRERSWPLGLLLLFAGVNVGVALVALPHVPGNPRYLLFLMSVLPIFLAMAFGTGAGRAVLGVLIAASALASFAHIPDTLSRDARWRTFVRGLESEGVRWCYTDFHLATRINFLSGERVICTSKLGPVTTEYFFSYRHAVEAAPEAAYVAVNRTSAGRLGQKLSALGVSYERRDLMKPVLLNLSRKVDPEEIFPHREFPWR